MTDSGSASDPAPSTGPFGFLRRWLSPGREAPTPAAEAPGAAGELVEQARSFQDLSVDDVMKPRSDIVAVEVATPFEEVVARFVEAEHSRMPVYRETLDDPVGVVHMKDIFKLLAATPSRRPKPGDPVLQRRRSLVRKPLYVPASMPAAELLASMQNSHTHLALVIDEFGGTDGLVTLEDLLERLVGEISDEHDDEQEHPPIVVDDDGWVVDGRLQLAELETAMGGEDLASSDLDEEIDTVAGLVTALAGRVPRPREHIPHPSGFAFEVLAADPRRVKRVRVRRQPATPAPPPEA
jgi:CBS domain containing-hemolysin-like protein